MSQPRIIIYTDGGARKNPGPGAWAAILSYQGQEKRLAGFEPHTTNNRMEMRAAIEGLAALKHRSVVTIFTDSRYLQDGITKWIHGWKARGWRTASNEPVKNQDLWEKLADLCLGHEIVWQWVKGHNGDPGNEAADALVQETIDRNYHP